MKTFVSTTLPLKWQWLTAKTPQTTSIQKAPNSNNWNLRFKDRKTLGLAAATEVEEQKPPSQPPLSMVVTDCNRKWLNQRNGEWLNGNLLIHRHPMGFWQPWRRRPLLHQPLTSIWPKPSSKATNWPISSMYGLNWNPLKSFRGYYVNLYYFVIFDTGSCRFHYFDIESYYTILFWDKKLSCFNILTHIVVILILGPFSLRINCGEYL